MTSTLSTLRMLARVPGLPESVWLDGEWIDVPAELGAYHMLGKTVAAYHDDGRVVKMGVQLTIRGVA